MGFVASFGIQRSRQAIPKVYGQVVSNRLNYLVNSVDCGRRDTLLLLISLISLILYLLLRSFDFLNDGTTGTCCAAH